MDDLLDKIFTPQVIPLLVSFISAIPLMINALTSIRKTGAEADNEFATATSTLLGGVDVIVHPLEERIVEANAELTRQRRIDRVQRRMLNTQTEFIAFLITMAKVLTKQLTDADIEPIYKLNGEVAEYRERLERVQERLDHVEECRFEDL